MSFTADMAIKQAKRTYIAMAKKALQVLPQKSAFPKVSVCVPVCNTNACTLFESVSPTSQKLLSYIPVFALIRAKENGL